jgi:uncharacterized protein with gpF-like domain
MADKVDPQNKRVQQIERQTDSRVTLVDIRVDTLIESLRAFLDRNLVRILEDLRGKKISAREAAKALGGLESELEAAGLGARLDKVKQLFADEWEAVKTEFEATTGKDTLLSQITKANVDAIADDRLQMAGKMINQYLGDVTATVMNTVIAGKPMEPDQVLEDAGSRVYSDLKTEIRTTVMAYNRIVNLEKAKKAGITKFLYVGPDDQVTRPFCVERVGQVWSTEEIDSWDNGQGLPANIYCGGYNCRHHLRPLSDELAAELTDNTADG